MYLIALAEWHVTPEYINEEWTEELLALMFIKRREMISKIARPNQPAAQKFSRVSNDDFFKKHANLLGVKRK
jgi:hypothetical protein